MKSKDAKSKAKKPPNMSDEEIRKAYTELGLTPSVSVSESILTMFGDVKLATTGLSGYDHETLRNTLIAQHERIQSGDLSRVEAMLIDQAHLLQAMIMYFMQHATRSDLLAGLDTYSRLALKAQNQCRQTLATLIELKNPKRTQFIKQQNNAVNQQINQERKVPAESVIKSKKSTNKLLDKESHERLDNGAAEEAIGANQELETVGEVNRPKKRRGKAKG